MKVADTLGADVAREILEAELLRTRLKEAKAT
jgi:hypothetical protein